MAQGHILKDQLLLSTTRPGDRAHDQQHRFEHGLIVA
jgi:hypothetical protein